MKEYLRKIGINLDGEIIDDSFVAVIKNSNEYGKIFSILEKSEDLNIMDQNQVVTEDGSSLLYESISEDYILNLIADFENDIYQLVVTEV